jgi:hypothetical protein
MSRGAQKKPEGEDENRRTNKTHKSTRRGKEEGARTRKKIDTRRIQRRN